MPSLNGFDATIVEPTVEYVPIPNGEYLAVIRASQEKPTKDGRGTYVEFEFQIIEGEHKGRNVYARLNLNNPKAETVKYARADLSAICRAVGVLKPLDSVELHDIPLIISVKCERRKDDAEKWTNRISGYKKKSEGIVGSSAAASSSATTTAGAGRAPWEK